MGFGVCSVERRSGFQASSPACDLTGVQTAPEEEEYDEDEEEEAQTEPPPRQTYGRTKIFLPLIH